MKIKTEKVHPDTKDKLLTSAITLMLEKGFTATSVEEICEAAGVTKGSFFHYFESKEELAKVALHHFSDSAQVERFETAPYNSFPDPLDRLNGFLDSFIAWVKKPEDLKSCLIGNLTQELSQTHSGIRSVCAESFSSHNRMLQHLMDEVLKTHPPKKAVDTESLAKYFCAVIQGSILLAKATQDTELVVENIEHFRRYLQTLFPEKAP